MPLKGVKIIELAGLAPVPFCGTILADFGASVLRVDKVSANVALDSLGNGKKSLALNLKSPKGVTILRNLSKQSDVLIEPYRCGVMESLGLGPDVLLRDNPKLIYARLSGYGHYGYYSPRAGHDINYLAVSGLLSLFGRHGEKPVFPANLAADFGGGGMMCAMGILLALYERTQSGLGQVVDNSMVEGTAYLGSWLYRSRVLPIWNNERGKNMLDGGSHLYEVYETKDGKYMTVGALEPQFYSKLLEALGLNEEIAPYYEKSEESKILFASKFKERSRDEWSKIFDKLDACVAPVLTVDEAPYHKHNAERESFTKLSDGIFAPNPAPKLSRSPGISKSTQSAPHCGEHTFAILRSLNYTDKEIDELEMEGVISCYKRTKL